MSNFSQLLNFYRAYVRCSVDLLMLKVKTNRFQLQFTFLVMFKMNMLSIFFLYSEKILIIEVVSFSKLPFF